MVGGSARNGRYSEILQNPTKPAKRPSFFKIAFWLLLIKRRVKDTYTIFSDSASGQKWPKGGTRIDCQRTERTLRSEGPAVTETVDSVRHDAHVLWTKPIRSQGPE